MTLPTVEELVALHDAYLTGGDDSWADLAALAAEREDGTT